MACFLVNLCLCMKEWHRSWNIQSGISEGLCMMFRKNRLGFQIFGPSRSCRRSDALFERAQRLTLHGLTLWCFHGSCRLDKLLQVISIVAWQDNESQNTNAFRKLWGFLHFRDICIFNVMWLTRTNLNVANLSLWVILCSNPEFIFSCICSPFAPKSSTTFQSCIVEKPLVFIVVCHCSW